MSIVAKVKQQPADVQDYDISYDEWFPTTDKITWATVTCSPTFPGLVSPTCVIDSTKRIVKVWMYAGGTTGVDYKLTVTARTTDDGNIASSERRVKEAELVIKIREV